MRISRARAAIFGSVVLALALAAPRPAWAGEGDAARAAELRRRGDEAMDAGRAAEALDAYRGAATIEPGPALDYNIGRALLATGDFAGALTSFERFQREAPDDLKQRTHRLAEIMRELESKVASIEVTGTPAGARVIVRGAPIGVLPLAARINAGAVDVRVESEGYEPFAGTVDATPGTPAKLAVTLVPVRTTARLEIVARPSGARVRVDGGDRGAAPVALDLAPGPHDVIIDAPSHKTRRIPLDLSRGEARHVDVTLDRESTPLVKSPWFWAGVGVIVASAIVTTVAITQPRPPDDGSLGTFDVP